MNTKTVDAESCQIRCQLNENCNFFLYLTRNHPQWFKRRECRLLRSTGILVNKDNHVSGPKYCNTSSSFYEDQTVNTTTTYLQDYLTVAQLSNVTTHQNLTQLVDDFLSLICKFQVFSGNALYLNERTFIGLKIPTTLSNYVHGYFRYPVSISDGLS